MSGTIFTARMNVLRAPVRLQVNDSGEDERISSVRVDFLPAVASGTP